ncbi:cupin domain-containing protein [Aurantibacter crassamenti]|uniref:cupin domain-containing protein n=1 Tax=Aurantibacter crassamenti TaxID=1837375 RepID=UPI0019395E53|nr:cupin domain-containing protein [Aurantibacter crassamenti]MBM1106399.1 cupin domain-containing protein [Aurantibacter crassamenti]
MQARLDNSLNSLIIQPLYSYVLLFVLFISVMGFSQEEYKQGPQSDTYENIPKGKLTQHTFKSTIFSNTIRDYYVYVPEQYNAKDPAALMVFQDGHTYVQEDGHFRVPTVFDNLIAQEKMPVTIGLFINPGHSLDSVAVESPWRSSNRSFEYDDVSDTYGRFLLEEMIPELKKNYSISDDPKMRAIGGISSGGICAFSAAWFFPEQFQKVLSHIGSFTNIRGGHSYPSMIRKTDKKDIKIFLQDGDGDLNNEHGNWWLANLQMESSLKYMDYNYKFEPGKGAHNGNHGGAILPQSLTWLWNDVVPQTVAEGLYEFPNSNADTVILKGETSHYSKAELKTVNLTNASQKMTIKNSSNEQIFIIKEGEVEVSVQGKKKTIGPNSVFILLPQDKITLSAVSPNAIFYTMDYVAKNKVDLRRGKKDGGSQIIDFDDLKFEPHDKGGLRNYFRRSTAMCPYYEMHVTSLNAGIKSHEPHTHFATEIILMIDGETEMEIGNQLYSGKKGDVYFVPSNVPHAIRTTGDKQSMYFAYQWH